MKKSTKSKRRRQPRSQRSAPELERRVFDVREQIRECLLSDIRQSVADTAHQLVQEEVDSLVGEPWSRKGDSPFRRNGRTETTIFLDGEPHELRRTRVRDENEGTEYPLQTVRALRSRDALDDDVKARLIRGITTRNYEGALTSLSNGLGLKKSAVSAAFQRGAQKDLDALNGRSLSDWTFCAVYIDGTGFADHTCLVAMGIELGGTKRILGILEGASENAELVRGLLSNLQERGLTLTKRSLFVLDGSKALRRGVCDVFGKRALVQRCTIHKLKNILSYLPPSYESEARRRLNAAWNLVDYAQALHELQKVHRWLASISESAAASLKEALKETLTIHRLGITGALRKTLITTNPIESAFDVVKTHARRVKRWNGPAMVMRWAATGLVKAEANFRRVKGYRAIPQLVTALENTPLLEGKDVA